MPASVSFITDDNYGFSSQASVRESLGRLQISYIDLIQTHDIEFTTMDQVTTRSRLPSRLLAALVTIRTTLRLQHQVSLGDEWYAKCPSLPENRFDMAKPSVCPPADCRRDVAGAGGAEAGGRGAPHRHHGAAAEDIPQRP